MKKPSRIVATSIAALAATLLLASADHSFAVSGTWLPNPTNGNWEPAAGQTNWTNGTGVGAFPGAVVGAANTDIATFNGPSTFTNIIINNPGGARLNLGGITFTGSAANYVIGVLGGQEIFCNSGPLPTTVLVDSGLKSKNAIFTINAPFLMGAASLLSFINDSANGQGKGAGTLIIAGGVNVLNAPGGTAGGTVFLGGNNTNANTVSGDIRNGTVAGVNIVSVVKNGAGRWVLTGANTYTGNTTINEGTLIVNGSNQSPNTFVNSGGTLGGIGVLAGQVSNHGVVSPGNSPGTLTLKGDYRQFNDGTLQIEVAGRGAGRFDQLKVGGRADLDGTLDVTFLPKPKVRPGDRLKVLTAGRISGEFDSHEVNKDTLLSYHVDYQEQAVVVEVEAAFEKFARRNNLTQNQIAVANGLDSAAHGSYSKKLYDFLIQDDLRDLPQNLDKIAPEELTSIFMNGVALAQVQSLNVQRRADDIRQGSSGFSAAGLAMQGSGPGFNGPVQFRTGSAGPTGNIIRDGKESKEMKEVAPVENRWGAFLTGVGEWVDVDGNGNARGYDITTGGFTVGVDYKVSPNFALGVLAGYAGTGADLTKGGSVLVNGGKLGVYATTFAGGWYADVAATGGLNGYDTKRSALQGTARGSTNGGELNVLAGTGYDWKVGNVTFGPTATFNYTLVGIDGFTERGSLAPLNIASRNAESVRSAVGFKVSVNWRAGGVVIRPEVRTAWQHEYGDSSYALDATFANGAGSSFLVNGPQIGRDSLLLGAGFSIECSERVSMYLYYDGELAREDFHRTAVTGGVRVAF